MNNVKFIRINNGQPAADYITKTLIKHLRGGHKILWLLPGGSAVSVAVNVADRIKDCDLKDMAVSLTDERWGAPGHKDSNWRQLNDAGFRAAGASTYEVLKGKDLEMEAREFADFLNKSIKEADYSLALAGMGADGHIFGIKPGSPAAGATNGVIGYEWDDYARITPAAGLIKKLDEVIIYAIGNEKKVQLDRLSRKLSPKTQPAQLLKQLKSVRIYNDYKGDRL